MNNELIQVDLKEDMVYGFEDDRNGFIIENMCRSIKLGAEFPAVPMVEYWGGLFLFADLYLASNQYKIKKIDGGHHRCIAHYLRDSPLNVRLFNFNDLDEDEKGKIEKGEREIPISGLSVDYSRGTLKDYLDYCSSVPESFQNMSNKERMLLEYYSRKKLSTSDELFFDNNKDLVSRIILEARGFV